MIQVNNPQKSLNIPTSVALGTFDGLHVGHMAIINKMCSEGRYKKCVLTFSNNPATVATGADIKAVISNDEKVSLLEKSGVDYLLSVEFNKEFMSLTAEAFFDKYIIEILGAKEIYVGYNYTFGKNKGGTIAVLQEMCDKQGIILNVMPPVYVGDETVSSTRIRSEVAKGNLALAKELLGRGVTIGGIVTEGNKLGRTIGFPTANIPINAVRVIPPDGVYSAKTVITGREYGCIVNIGARPTVSDKGERLVEAHIVGFDGSLYGEKLNFELAEKIRDICKFDSLEGLKNQLKQDTLKIVSKNI